MYMNPIDRVNDEMAEAYWRERDEVRERFPPDQLTMADDDGLPDPDDEAAWDDDEPEEEEPDEIDDDEDESLDGDEEGEDFEEDAY